MSYTPGPWRAEQHPHSCDTQYWDIHAASSADRRAVTIADVYPIDDDGTLGAEAHANAVLIAAAPLMAEALANLVRLCAPLSRGPALAEARAALLAAGVET